MMPPEQRAMARTQFTGAKAGLFCGTRLLCYLRDDRPGLPWRGRWDLPGGGREGDESPESCLLRELHEEFGLQLGPERLELALALPAMAEAGPGAKPAPDQPAAIGWFFAGRLTASELAAVRFGDEGQYWQAMELADYLRHPLAIPPLQDRLRQVMSYGFGLG